MISGKIILDVDTGIDDALAIIMLKPYLASSIVGITTCGGNVEVEQVTKNTLAILSLLDSDIPVCQGSTRPLAGGEYVYAKYYHGENGLVDIELPVKFKPQGSAAAEFILASAEKYGGLTIISTAPPTNIAAAYLLDPSLPKKINGIYLMGGAFNVPGNESIYAETNFFQDPEAVRIILQHFSNVSIIPLDVTNKTTISRTEMRRICIDKPVGKFCSQAIGNWFELFGDKKRREFELYDPLAVSVIGYDLLAFEPAMIDVNCDDKRGQIVSGQYRVDFASQVRAVEFKEQFFKTINDL